MAIRSLAVRLDPTRQSLVQKLHRPPAVAFPACFRRSIKMATTAVATQETSSKVSTAYDDVCKKLKEISTLEGISGLLNWDEMVMMPSGSAPARGRHKAAMEGVLYDKRTDKELGRLLEELWAARDTLDEVAAAVVRDARKSYIRATALPKELAQRLAELETEGYAAWMEAKAASDFSKFAPVLKKLVAAAREKATCVDPSRPPYDVLLEEYEKGMTSERLNEIFSEVREGLVPLLAELKQRGTAPDKSWTVGSWDVDKQAALSKQVAFDLGFNPDTGRLDVSVHPFTVSTHATDVRITTRFKPDDLVEGVTGTIHETGHAMYEQGLNPEWEGLPVAGPLSTGVHESQSLFWERMVGLSKPFARYLLPKIREHFPDFPERPYEELHAALNVIQNPSLIRTEADEVTYPLHIILRYEIEQGLIEGSVEVDDIPRLWGEKMEKYLGVKPPTDVKGCLQDVHWSCGLMGYFPTYSLGAMFACQLYAHIASQLPGMEESIAAGDFKPIKEWLNVNIHQKGSLYPSGDELMVAVTGSPLQPKVFLEYLRNKYIPLYKLQ